MEKKSYCTQNAGDCPTCSLVNYGRDCQNNPVNYADFEAVSGNDDKDAEPVCCSRMKAQPVQVREGERSKGEAMIKEKIKKHLISMISNVDYDKVIEENFKYFEYLKQPKKIADAIARTI